MTQPAQPPADADPEVVTPDAAPEPTVWYRFVVADDPEPWSEDGQPGGLLDLPVEPRLRAWERLAADAALVVICGSRQGAAVRRESALARAHLEARVAVVPLPLGPLGQSIAADICESVIGAGRPAAEVVSRLPELATGLLDLGLVTSIGTLDLPGITLRHHASSYLPGTRLFAVQLTPEPAVTRVHPDGRLGGGMEALHPPVRDPSSGVTMTVLGPRPVPPELLERCRVRKPVISSAPLPISGFWHDAEATEIVVGPVDPLNWVLLQLPVLERWPCRWCNEPLAEPMRTCPFCGYTRR